MSRPDPDGDFFFEFLAKGSTIAHWQSRELQSNSHFEASDNNDRLLLLREKLDIKNSSALVATNPFSTHRWQGHAKHIHLDMIADIKFFVRVDNLVNFIEHKFRIEIISRRKRYMNGIIKGWSIQS